MRTPNSGKWPDTVDQGDTVNQGYNGARAEPALSDTTGARPRRPARARVGRLPATADAVVASRHSRRDYVSRRLLAAGDLTAVAAAAALWFASTGTSMALDEFALSLVMLPVSLLVFRAYGLYERDAKRVSHRTIDDLPWVLNGALVCSVLFWGLFRLFHTKGLGGRDFAIIGALAVVLVLLGRTMMRAIIRTMLGPERVLVIGDARLTALLARKLRNHPEYGLDPVGVISASDESATTSVLPMLGHLRRFNLEEIVARHKIERVLVSHMEIEEASLLDVLHRCRRLGLKMSVVPRLFDALGSAIAIDDVEGITVLGVNPPILSPSARAIKRAMDVIGAGVALLLTAPLLLAIAVAIKLDSPGPILFRQHRIGRGGERFRLLKFRTMLPNAEQMTAELLSQSSDPNWLKLENDPRITRIGQWLRRLSLDELPQLWNVLKGEMSLVGPRPLIEREDLQLEDWARARIDLTPGITGLWQVLGRTNIPFAEMAKLDYVYVTSWTLWGDVRLLARTLPVVLSRRGAN